MKVNFKMVLVALTMACCTEMKAQEQPPLRIAYVDLEKVNENYGLYVERDDQLKARYKKMQDALAAKQKNMENTMASLSKQIENKGKAIEAKTKKTPATGGYKTEAQYNADMKAYQQLQVDAQSKMEKLRAELAQLEQKQTEEYLKLQNAAQQEVTDSLNSYIETYNKEKGYDFILLKNATLFANPAYDVTDDIISGLNRIYQESKNPQSAPAETPAQTEATEQK